MIWQDYKKLYWNALKQYSPTFKKELQRQVDTYCRRKTITLLVVKQLKRLFKSYILRLVLKWRGSLIKTLRKELSPLMVR